MGLDRRVTEVLTEENKQPEGWWYLSCAGDEGFHGAAIVRGRGMFTALLTAKSHGIQFGGDEVLAISMSDAETLPEPKFRNRLLTKADVDHAFAGTGGGVAISV